MPNFVAAAAVGASSRLRAIGTLPTEYNAGVSFHVTQTTTARFATVNTTSGFFGTTGGRVRCADPGPRGAVRWDTHDESLARELQ